MFRRFSFEEDIYCTLDCVPMTVRRKLDRIGLKIGLANGRRWARASVSRFAICRPTNPTNATRSGALSARP